MTPDQARALLDAHLENHPLTPAQGSERRDAWFVALVQRAYEQGAKDQVRAGTPLGQHADRRA